MTMDDLVYLQVASTDLSLYDKFNAAYRGYFTTKELPAREIYWGSVATSWRPFRNPGDCGAPLIHPAFFILCPHLESDRQTHNPKVVSSNLTPATNQVLGTQGFRNLHPEALFLACN